jgi:hypothetical protein
MGKGAMSDKKCDGTDKRGVLEWLRRVRGWVSWGMVAWNKYFINSYL